MSSFQCLLDATSKQYALDLFPNYFRLCFFFLYSSEAEIIKYLNDLEPDTLSIILCRARLVHGPHSNEH